MAGIFGRGWKVKTVRDFPTTWTFWAALLVCRLSLSPHLVPTHGKNFGRRLERSHEVTQFADIPLAESLLGNDARRKASEDRHPLKAIGDPDDVAAKFVTAQIIAIDGGMGSVRTF